MSRSRSFELGDQAERSTDHWTMPHSGPAITTLCDNSQGNPKRDESCGRRPNLLKAQFVNAESVVAASGLPGQSQLIGAIPRRFRRAAERKTRQRPIAVSTSSHTFSATITAAVSQ